MYNWTYREGLKLLVGVWINHLYIHNNILKKTKKVKGVIDGVFPYTGICDFLIYESVF